MRRLTVYNSYYKDEIINQYELNTIQAQELVEQLLSGTHYDILITNQEDT